MSNCKWKRITANEKKHFISFDESLEKSDYKLFYLKNAVMGGSFDYLHNGHKVYILKNINFS